jgi:hypothetical protein
MQDAGAAGTIHGTFGIVGGEDGNALVFVPVPVLASLAPVIPNAVRDLKRAVKAR